MIHLTKCEIVALYKDLTEEQWLELRGEGIGGSDAPHVMNMSKWGSPLSLVTSKTGRVKPKDLSASEPVWYGNWLEKHIRTDLVKPYLKEHLDIEAEIIAPYAIWRNKEFPYIMINVDGWVRIGKEIFGLEIKTGNSYVLSEWGGVNGSLVPDAYYCQVQHYMMATGIKKWYVFGVIGGSRLLRVVERNEEFIDDLRQREGELWAIIEENNPLNFPFATGLDCDTEAVKALPITGNGKIDDHKAMEFVKCLSIEKEVKKKKAELRNQIVQDLEGSEQLESEKYLVKNGKRFSVKEF